MRKTILILLLLLTGCQSATNDNKDANNINYCGVESLGEWNEITWLHSVYDEVDDYDHFGGDLGPSPVVSYPPSDLKEAHFSFDDEFVYIKFVFAGTIPGESIRIDANGEELYIHSQGMNLAINFDYKETSDTTGSLWGVDAFFAVGIHYYSHCIEPYAPYEFESTDIHSMTASIYGDSHPTLGGFGTNYVIARYPTELIKGNFSYDQFQIYGWAEAEGFTEDTYAHSLTPRFHEFIHDELETTFYDN